MSSVFFRVSYVFLCVSSGFWLDESGGGWVGGVGGCAWVG